MPIVETNSDLCIVTVYIFVIPEVSIGGAYEIVKVRQLWVLVVTSCMF